MKRLILLIVTLATTATQLFAAHLCPSTGRVVDEQGKAVEYATVVLLKGTEQVAGMATDAEGHFVLKAAPGEYTLWIQYLGFDPVKKPVRVEQESHLGDFVMHASATGIQSVEVKARLVRREADRFVVDVANAPAAIGKDGIELLERAPGVWIDGEKISINGKSGSKVYVNDRELRMEPEQLLTYLRSLRAEEIQKIEVVPTTGADYDADSAGGIIRITLKKRRENGVDGSVSFNTSQGTIIHRYDPSANINVHSGRADFYASAWGSFGKDRTTTDEQTLYNTADKALNAHSEMKGRNRSFGASAGAVVEIDDKNSVGAEVEYWRNRNGEPNNTYTDFRDGGTLTHTDSHFDNLNVRNNYSATFNYIRKIDTLGSTLKLLLDYTRRETDAGNDNFSRITAPGSAADSTYRDNAASVYNVATATLALEKKFSPRWSLKAGAKYTYNDMHNDALYEYLKGDAWVRNDKQSFTINYTENIAAAYAIASAQLGRWSLVAGLRGEYTHTTGKDVGQDYFSLFPNANVSFALSKEKG
ncbi:outer membrane beta-barrel protein, partial [Alistipes sp.]|uniref:outer membrane beta-barrel protein n=1 Tax=Alistipes sp. TaxID=1872444 RepID=UPI00307C6313